MSDRGACVLSALSTSSMTCAFFATAIKSCTRRRIDWTEWFENQPIDVIQRYRTNDYYHRYDHIAHQHNSTAPFNCTPPNFPHAASNNLHIRGKPNVAKRFTVRTFRCAFMLARPPVRHQMAHTITSPHNNYYNNTATILPIAAALWCGYIRHKVCTFLCARKNRRRRFATTREHLIYGIPWGLRTYQHTHTHTQDFFSLLFVHSPHLFPPYCMTYAIRIWCNLHSISQ